MPNKQPHKINSSLDYLELKKKYDELQLRVTRFSVIEQELIHARNQMDREVMIYRQMQQFNSKALEDIDDEIYSRLVTDTLIEIFEIEVGFVCIDIPNTGNPAIRHIEGHSLNEEQKFDLLRRAADRTQGPDTGADPHSGAFCRSGAGRG